ncbi:RNA-binding protein [Streptomyces sp. NBC_01264]|uniref:RNA-binding protein n=1 Tax=Streptomyces sp. NBC_01264 TaxID=2903804 RepID=UPI0022540E23|nr:RNA-binding protein [Streptomyces sp. NBC_01264]MCX4780600.1 RNA-binding protein [Streptomyces sp. NBC_01264]
MPFLPHAYRVTKYDPADRAPDGTYRGTEDTDSDHGPVEAAYLAAIAAFARESGVELLTVREPQVFGGSAHFGREPAVEGYGLAGLFPDGPAGFHDGARVTVPAALELLRGMLRGDGPYCRLEATEEGREVFAVQVGWDLYVYVGSRTACGAAVVRTRELGIFAEPIEVSPYDPEFDESYELRAADEEFWERVRASAARGEAGLVEEQHAWTRWHRIDGGGEVGGRLGALRAGLAPRARLNVWPGLSADTAGLIAGLPEEFSLECVWEDADGRIRSGLVDEEDRAELVEVLSGARAAALLPASADEYDPLFTGVLPDPDGVVRARWQV